MKYYYFPIFKSRHSELRAYKELSSNDKKDILPILELTKSRVSKNNENGSVEKKMEEIIEAFGDNYFILDLTMEDTLKNDEIDKMLFVDDGGKAWTNFVKKYQNRLNFIPCIHYSPDCPVDMLVEQIENLSSFPVLALRLDALDEENRSYLEKIQSFLSKIIVILDAEYQRKDFDFFDYIEKIADLNIQAIIYASSAFPPTIPISDPAEVKSYDLGFQRLYANFPNAYYGDYALTFPRRYDTQARGWIPRIDVPIIKNNKIELLYCRYRTNMNIDTGLAYINCAKAICADSRLIFDLGHLSWGEQVLLDTKSGYISGKSPSFWISVRNNIYISKAIANCKKCFHRVLDLSSLINGKTVLADEKM